MIEKNNCICRNIVLVAKNLKKIGVVASMMNTCIVLSQNTRFLEVKELFDLGINNSMQIKVARLQSEIASENKKTAQTNLFPSMDFNLRGGVSPYPILFHKGLTEPTKFKEFPLGSSLEPISNWQQQYAFQLEEPIYQGGKLKHTIDKYALEKEISLLDVNRQAAEIKLILIRKYLDLIEAYKQRDVVLHNIEDATFRLKDIQQLKSQGMSTENDLLRTQLLLSNYELSKLEINNSIAINSQQLDIALGIDEKTLLEGDTSLLSHSFDLQTYDAYLQQAYASFPELQIAQTSIHLAEKEKQLYKSNYYPSLSLVSSTALSRPAPPLMVPNNYFFSYILSLSLSYNLSSLYQNLHRVRSAQLSINIEQAKEEQQKRNIRSNVNEAFVRHQEAKERIKTLSLSVTQANENYRELWNKYNNQLATMTDVLEASSVRINAEFQLVSARILFIYTYYQLLYSIGNL